MKKLLILGVAACLLVTGGLAVAQDEYIPAKEQRAFEIGPSFTADGKVIRPEGWRKWVYIGSPLTPDDMNGGEATFREFHNCYMDPGSFAAFERTGEFPNGTQIVKEMVLVGTKEASSGSGYFMGDFFGLELCVKDTVRFKDEPGGWVYYSFGHKAPPYNKTAEGEDAASCNSCHEASADTDWVFTQYYPVLRAAMANHSMHGDAAAKVSEKKKVDKPAMDAAMGAAGVATGDAKTHDEYSDKLFKWLQGKPYTEWPKEAAAHKSRSFSAHGNVRTYYNDKLDDSFTAGNKTHPIGSVSIKELFDKKDMTKHIGWAVALKVRETDKKGNGWYWYENVSLADNSKPVAASFGNSKCVGCHKPGTDFIRTKALKK